MDNQRNQRTSSAALAINCITKASLVSASDFYLHVSPIKVPLRPQLQARQLHRLQCPCLARNKQVASSRSRILRTSFRTNNRRRIVRKMEAEGVLHLAVWQEIQSRRAWSGELTNKLQVLAQWAKMWLSPQRRSLPNQESIVRHKTVPLRHLRWSKRDRLLRRRGTEIVSAFLITPGTQMVSLQEKRCSKEIIMQHLHQQPRPSSVKIATQEMVTPVPIIMWTVATCSGSEIAKQ